MRRPWRSQGLLRGFLCGLKRGLQTLTHLLGETSVSASARYAWGRNETPASSDQGFLAARLDDLNGLRCSNVHGINLLQQLEIPLDDVLDAVDCGVTEADLFGGIIDGAVEARRNSGIF